MYDEVEQFEDSGNPKFDYPFTDRTTHFKKNSFQFSNPMYDDDNIESMFESYGIKLQNA